ncbi:MAG: hypothetical protein GY832_09420 [Chloroflexi bacterium]|nr:hypothetical protein [Chloroflexota bacterium]
MSDPNPKDGEKTEKAKQVKHGALKALEGSEKFTPEEREGIASTIESEIARLLPELPEGIAEIAFKALGLSLDAADKLTSQQEHPSTNDKTDS